MHIFIIEDELLIRRELQILLENALYRVTAPDTFESVAHITRQIRETAPDLVLLDVNLPGISGFDICTQIRQHIEVPIIFLTSRISPMDELNGLLKGGDDYITKPYQAPVLLARIAAVLKRARGADLKETSLFSKGDVTLDIARCCLSCKGHSVDLTKNEMKILHLLFQHPGTFVPRMDLIEYLWENRIFIDDNTLSVHIAKIREKLKSVDVQNFIETRRGMGYRI